MTLVLITVVCYLLASAGIVYTLTPRRQAETWLVWVAAGCAVLLHGALHVRSTLLSGSADMHFFAALSLTGLGMSALTTLLAVTGRMRALGIVVYPLASTFLLFYIASPTTQHAPQVLDWRLQLHAWSALLAYATLAVAALLAVLLWMQERALRLRQLHDWLRALPPLTQLESLLFRTITAGFVLLSATLLTGLLFVHDFLGQHVLHKSVLSALSWLVFGVLLLGRWQRGWRGRVAVRWTLTAMALLVLAFFGSKFVLELMLQRT